MAMYMDSSSLSHESREQLVRCIEAFATRLGVANVKVGDCGNGLFVHVGLARLVFAYDYRTVGYSHIVVNIEPELGRGGISRAFEVTGDSIFKAVKAVKKYLDGLVTKHEGEQKAARLQKEANDRANEESAKPFVAAGIDIRHEPYCMTSRIHSDRKAQITRVSMDSNDVRYHLSIPKLTSDEVVAVLKLLNA